MPAGFLGNAMSKSAANAIVSHLKALRLSKGLTQTQLAERVGVQRQAIYDMESGRYLPNTAVALHLAAILECRVEDIFALETPPEDPPLTLIGKSSSENDTRLALARVRGELVGFPLVGKTDFRESMLPADGLLLHKSGRLRRLQPESALDQKALLMGCDPAFEILGAHVTRSRGAPSLLCRFASSQRALEALAMGHTHVAGTHLHNTGEDEANVALARHILGDFNGVVIGFSRFEEGLMVAPGNPLKIRNVQDLARRDVRLVNREPGAALRSLLEDWLRRERIPVEAVSGFGDLVASHSEGAQRVLYGTADAALGLRVVASVYGLDFVGISAVRCDLVIPEDLTAHPAVKVLLDVIQSRSFREELAHLPGYDTSETGNVIVRR
jgi:molybdate-binding protein/DNA-binding XRE family transcriptional regulator